MKNIRSLARAFLPVICLAVLAAGCNSETKKQVESAGNMQRLALEANVYKDANGAWPATLADLEESLGSAEYAALIVNPLTGDNPGYEFVAPPEGMTMSSQTVIIYQLRGGQRDTTLPVGFADAHVGANP